MIILLA